MRLVSFLRNGQARVGIAKDDGVIDLSDQDFGRSVKHMLRVGALDQVREVAADRDPDIAIDDIRFLPCVVNPSSTTSGPEIGNGISTTFTRQPARSATNSNTLREALLEAPGLERRSTAPQPTLHTC